MASPSRKRVAPTEIWEAHKIGVCRVQHSLVFYCQGSDLRVRDEISACSDMLEQLESLLDVPWSRFHDLNVRLFEPGLNMAGRFGHGHWILENPGTRAEPQKGEYYDLRNPNRLTA